MVSEIAISRPELTMPDAEAGLLRDEYSRAGAVLEYGSGGSTVLAGELGKRVWSVESDPDWARMMRGWFAANPPRGQVEIIHSDIGATREWGHPVDHSGWKTFARYPLAVWDRGDMEPDVVLVDGRFRPGCALAAAFRTRKPLVLLFDDYAPRAQFHKVEEFIGKPEMVGRMARFDVAPTLIQSDKLLKIVNFMTRP